MLHITLVAQVVQVVVRMDVVTPVQEVVLVVVDPIAREDVLLRAVLLVQALAILHALVRVVVGVVLTVRALVRVLQQLRFATPVLQFAI
jgi:hypothetical protein